MQAHFTGLQPHSVHGVNAKGGNYLLLINLACPKLKYLEPKYYFLGRLYILLYVFGKHIFQKHLAICKKKTTKTYLELGAGRKDFLLKSLAVRLKHNKGAEC